MAMKPDEILAEMVKVYGLNGGRAQAWIEGLQDHLSAQAKVRVTKALAQEMWVLFQRSGGRVGGPLAMHTVLESFAARLSQGALEAAPNDDKDIRFADEHKLFVYEVDFGEEGKGRYIRLNDFNKVCESFGAKNAQVSVSDALNRLEAMALAGEQLHGDDVSRFRATADKIAPQGAQGVQGEAVASIQVPREGLPRQAQFIPHPAWMLLAPGTHDLYTHPAVRAALPEGLWDLIRQMVELHNARGCVLRVHMDRLAGMLTAAPQPAGEARVVPKGWMWFSADLSCLCNANNRNPRATVGLIRDHAGQVWWHSLSEEDKETTGLYVYAEAPTFEQAFELACNLTKKEIAAPASAGKEG